MSFKEQVEKVLSEQNLAIESMAVITAKVKARLDALSPLIEQVFAVILLLSEKKVITDEEIIKKLKELEQPNTIKDKSSVAGSVLQSESPRTNEDSKRAG